MPINLRPIDAVHSEFMGQNLDLNPQADTGFKENYGAALGMAIDEELSISSMINAPDFKPRNEELWRLIKEERLHNHDAYIIDSSPSFVEYDWAALARYAQEQGFDIQTDTEILGENRELLAERRAYAQDIMDRASATGFLGQITGYLHGGTVDPVNAAMTALGPLAFGRYIGATGSVLRTMAVEGGLGVASEAAIAPFVHEWKETIGVDYTIEDVLVNMAATGALNAGIGGAAEWIGQAIKGAKQAGLDTTPLELTQNEFKRLAQEFGEDADPTELLMKLDGIEKEMKRPPPPPKQEDAEFDEDVIILGQDTTTLDEGVEFKGGGTTPEPEPEPTLPDIEVYLSVEGGMQKIRAQQLDKQFDELVKYIDETMGIPICGR